MKKSLAQKFSFCFHVPLIICTVLSILVTIPLIGYFFDLLSKDPTILKIYEDNIERKARPILLNVMSILCVTFQKYINNLSKIREFYRESIKLLKLNENNINEDDYKKMISTIKQIMFNGYNQIEINKFKTEYYDGESPKDLLLFRAKWYTKPTESDLLDKFDDNKDDPRFQLIVKQLYLVANMIPLLKTAYELSKSSDEFSIMFTSTELFIEYPVNEDSLNTKYLYQYDHTNVCSNNDGNFPNYYYFKCRPYYYALEKAMKKGINFALSDLYKYSYGYSGVTACLNFEDTLKDSGNVVICQDILIEEMNKSFEKFNNQVTGYFFITKVGSYIPLYYPNSEEQDEHMGIINLEFDLNSEYYANEVSNYSSYVERLISEMNVSKNTTIETYMQSFTLKKNAKDYKYTIIPVTLFYDDKYDQKSHHMLSVVFVRPNGLDLDLFNRGIEAPIILSLLYIYVSSIIALISKYLISSVANNIVKTIKVIKKMLETDYEITTNETKSNEIAETNASMLKGEDKPLLLLKRSHSASLNRDLPVEEESDSGDDDDEDEDEDQSKYRSNNLQELFVKLVDMKNTFKNLNYPSKTSEKLPFLVHAQKIFVNNNSIYSTCQSNISSIFIKYKHYDKAISHLLSAIDKVKAENETADNIKKQFRSENLAGRYLKLFYCYKSYFKEIKQFQRMNNIPSTSFCISHHIQKYKQCVDDFVSFSRSANEPKDLSLALLEKLEEEITFEMNDNNTKISKVETVKTILDLFTELDHLNENIIVSNYNVMHLINILKYDCDMVNSMDIPPSILTQHTLYLKGNFYLKCGHYKLAIEHFEKSLNYGNIGNISIRINTLKKLIKIAKIYQNVVKSEMEFGHDFKSKSENENNKNRKIQLENFIYSINEELIKYKYYERDICFILNLTGVKIHSDQFSNAIKALRYIYDNIITYKDRLAIIVYMNGIFKIIVNLTQKTEENETSMINYINSFSSILTEQQEQLSSKFVKENIIDEAILYSYQYILKKQMGLIKDKRDNWYIYLTKDVSQEEIDGLKKKTLDSYYHNEQFHNLVVLLYENEVIQKDLRKCLRYNRSCVLNKNEIEKIKDIMGTIGEKQSLEFELEKYKDIN